MIAVKTSKEKITENKGVSVLSDEKVEQVSGGGSFGVEFQGKDSTYQGEFNLYDGQTQTPENNNFKPNL